MEVFTVMTEEEFEVERLTNTVRGAVDYWKMGPALAALGELRQRAMDGVAMSREVQSIADLTEKVNEILSFIQPMIDVSKLRRSAIDEARQDGRVTGLYQASVGVVDRITNPYAEGTPRYQAYDRALNDVSAKLDDAIQKECGR